MQIVSLILGMLYEWVGHRKFAGKKNYLGMGCYTVVVCKSVGIWAHV